MSAFYVGQKVRKVRGEWNIGGTATVFAMDNDPTGRTLGVITDQPGIGELRGEAITYPAGTEVWGFPSDFEPILPPGLESPERIAELFEPSPEVVQA